MKESDPHTKLNHYLFQLSELIKSPPTVLDYHDWKSNVDFVMQEIHDLSDRAYEELEDLVTQLKRLGEDHVFRIDADEPPDVISRSSELYFEQVSYLTSEMNRLKGV